MYYSAIAEQYPVYFMSNKTMLLVDELDQDR